MVSNTNSGDIIRPKQLAAYKWIWMIGVIAFMVVVGILARRGLGPRSNDFAANRTRPKIEKFTLTKRPVTKEAVPSKLTDDQEIFMDKVTGKSDAEMLGLVGNMSAEQRRMLAIRLSRGRGNLDKIRMFFKAWAGLDSLDAFQSAILFQYTS